MSEQEARQRTLPLEGERNYKEEADLFIEENPFVYALFKKFALEKHSKGKKFGVAALTERVRWEEDEMEKPEGAEFKINNSHRAYIARRLLKDLPQLAGCLEIRKARWEDA